MHNIIDELKREEMLDEMEPGRVDRRNRRVEERATRKKLNATLKPCPFCGGRARIEEREKPDGYCHYTVKFIQCTECHSKTEERICDGYYGEYCSDEEIVELWNRRKEN